MSNYFLDRVRVVTATTGTGTLNVGAAFSNSTTTPAEVGAVSGRSYTWVLEEGNDFEVFNGVYTTGTPPTVSRDTVLWSKIAGVIGTTKMTLAGNATLRCTLSAEDLNVLAASTGAAFVVFRYVATAAQTTFTGADANAATLLYSVGNITVFKNGYRLSATDYTASSGTSVVTTTACLAGDEIIIQAFNVLTTSAYNTATQYLFSATAAQTVFTGADANGVTLATNGFFTSVYKNGRRLSVTNDYTMTGTTVTLVAALACVAGDTIQIETVNSTNPLFGAGQIPATATNDDAAAGKVGEYLEQVVATGAVGFSGAGAVQAIATVTLTPGDWDVWGTVIFTGNGATNVSYAEACVSTSNSVRAIEKTATLYLAGVAYFSTVNGSGFTIAPPARRFSVNTNTPVYLTGFSNYSTNSMSGGGFIAARRRR